MVLIEKINGFRKSEVSEVVNRRLVEFIENGRGDQDRTFKELCFCLLTANFNAERVIKIQSQIGDGFFTLSREKMGQTLRALGHRFPSSRAEYIADAREKKDLVQKALRSLEGEERRGWFVNNVKGIGYKEASHFLRNTGHFEYSIIDFHIMDLLVRENIIDRPKALSRGEYMRIEGKLKEMSFQLGMNPGELDLYLWFMETGRVLK